MNPASRGVLPSKKSNSPVNFKLSILLSAMIAFACFIPKAEAGQKTSFQYYDSLTYQQYLKGQWTNLIQVGNCSLSDGFDFKNLRFRMGVAYYFKKNFRSAAYHLHKALKFDSYDTQAAFYYNLACEAGGRSGESFHVRGTPKPAHFVDFAYADVGQIFAPNVKDSVNLTDSVFYKELIQPISRTLTSFGLGLRPLSNLSVFLGVSNIDLVDRKSSGFMSKSIVRDHVDTLQYENDYYYRLVFMPKVFKTDFKNKQTSFYANVSYFPFPGLKITPAFHLLRITADRIFPYPVYNRYTDTIYLDKTNNSWHTALIDSTTDYSFRHSDTTYYDYSMSLSVTEEIGNFTVGINGTYSRMLNQKAYQLGATLDWYPFGNTNLYTHSSFTYRHDTLSSNTIFEQAIGARIYKKGWLEGSVTFGELNTYNERNAYLVYNQLYPLTKRLGLTFYPYIGKHLEVMLLYRFQMLGMYLTTSKINEVRPTLTNPQYGCSSLTTGIKWKF